MAGLYERKVAAQLKPDAALAFAHGFAILYRQIVPDPGRACFLVAPKGQGDMLREAYLRGGGLPALLAVTDDSPPDTWELAAAYAKAIGCLKGGGFPTTFREECIADQFGEQTVLCGGVVELVQAAFDTLVARGYSADNAYFECVHELKLIADLIHRYGLPGMRKRISHTAAYGGLTRGRRVVDQRVRQSMEQVLDELENGSFAREFLSSYSDPSSGIHALIDREARTQLALTGQQLHKRLADLELDDDPIFDPEKE
jgi:ketol-acid reductoisomerase